jgi:hypothetical protein
VYIIIILRYQGIYCSSNVAKDETWEVFLYPINIFVIVSRCKYNLVEKIFDTHIIKMQEAFVVIWCYLNDSQSKNYAKTINTQT